MSRPQRQQLSSSTLQKGQRRTAQHAHGLQVYFLRIKHVFRTFGSYHSAPEAMEVLENGLVMTSFEDSSIRLVDPDTALDAAVTLPQLSLQSLVSAR